MTHVQALRASERGFAALRSDAGGARRLSATSPRSAQTQEERGELKLGFAALFQRLGAASSAASPRSAQTQSAAESRSGGFAAQSRRAPAASPPSRAALRRLRVALRRLRRPAVRPRPLRTPARKSATERGSAALRRLRRPE
eukprot:CAMPEP_0174887856 /NCGR_PEP_ID=MMETSP0167-20121228/3077_1 /TAXON_ID=38298 /ORGANISM="Rhodella maculata, Strain CCMP736" /LENGTH=141 /DNA_ID=CAMNT_0016124529 /DNA_START=106 /DNA_END=530 /DNA_ORIENTATION=+